MHQQYRQIQTVDAKGSTEESGRFVQFGNGFVLLGSQARNTGRILVWRLVTVVDIS